jgi:hypothetical protein
MKKIKNNIIFPLLLTLMICLSSCFDEDNDEYSIVGPVATVPVFSIPNPLVTNTPNYRVAAGENLRVAIRYYSEHVKVTQYRVIEDFQDGSPTTTLYTVDVTDFDTQNSYLDTLEYTVPAFPVDKVFKLTIEIETENDLVNKKDLPMQVK